MKEYAREKTKNAKIKRANRKANRKSKREKKNENEKPQ
jgi:hypothetical protein